MSNEKKHALELLKAFVAATSSTMKKQCATDIQVGKPTQRTPGQSVDFDLAATIELKCDAFRGTVTFCYPETTFLGVMGGMFDMKFGAITNDIQDGAGELLNLIFGQVKSVLNDQEYGLQMAIPKVFRHDMELRKRLEAQAGAVIVPFKTKFGPLYMQLGSDPASEAKPPIVSDRFPVETRILIVDDMSTMRKLVRKVLASEGYKDIIEADDGKTAWEQIEKALQEGRGFGLIVSDWNMPIMKGLELLKRVRADSRTRDVPFLLLTAESEVHQIMEAVNAGVSAYVLKPFSADAFMEKLNGVYKKFALAAA